MKSLQRLCALFVLTLALTPSAFGGQMTTGIADPPPPPSEQTAQGEMSTGYTGDMTTGVTATDPATEFVLNLLQSLLSLF